MGEQQKSPPLGLVPKYIKDENRLIEIYNAIGRYIDDKALPIPDEWITEFNELLITYNRPRNLKAAKLKMLDFTKSINNHGKTNS